MKWFVVAAVLFSVLFTLTPAFADNLTVTSFGSDWQLVPGSSFGAATWVLPANLGASCGSENGTTCEPTGHWQLNQAAIGFGEYIQFNECNAAGACSPSDYILVSGDQINHTTDVYFFSDPTFPVDQGGFIVWNGQFYFLQAVYTEGNSDPNQCGASASTGGCVTSFAITGISGLTVVAGSDGESSWDPFGAGYDTGDGISFQGAVAPAPQVPEPASIALVAGGIAGLLRKRRSA